MNWPGLAADSEVERAVAQRLLAEVPLRQFIEEPLIAPEHDEVSRLILERHDADAFAPVAALTVGEFRDWLLADTGDLAALAAGIDAGDGRGRQQDHAQSGPDRRRPPLPGCHPLPQYHRLAGRLSTRLQPNHPTDDPRGIAASILDGLLYGSGDAVIGINPATDNLRERAYPAEPARRDHQPPSKSRRSPACWRMSRPAWN